MSSTIIDALTVDLAIARVWRYLGYGAGRDPDERVGRRLGELARLAGGLARPRGAFCLASGEQALAMGMPSPTELVMLGLCTIGPALEEEAGRAHEGGRLLDAVLLDALGSAAAEGAADALNEVMCAEAGRRGYVAERRVSPGYGAWDTSAQAALVGRLPAAALGITLTTGMMMVPRKSVSFALRLRQPALGAGRDPHDDPCEDCGLEACRYRRERRP